MKAPAVRKFFEVLVWNGRSRLARWFYKQALRSAPEGFVEALDERRSSLLDDDPLVDMLQRALSKRTGKLRVSDAFLICGIEAGKANQDQIERFGRAIRALGWERQRRYFNSELTYAYVNGVGAERDVELVVEYDPNMRSVRIEMNTQPA